MKQIDSSMIFNKIYFYQSIKFEEMGEDNDLRATQILFEDFIPSLQEQYRFPAEFKKIENKQQLGNQFIKIIGECVNNRIRPLIHIDAHGDPERGLQLFPSLEFIPWEELSEGLRKINVVCENNLMLVLTSCYGYNIIKPPSISITKPTPFYCCVGSDTSVPARFILDKFKDYYQEILTHRDINKAIETINEYFGLYLCERIFCKAIAWYIKTHCNGKNKKMRKEELITRWFEELKGTDVSIKEIRGKVKQHIKPNQHSFEYFKNKFLIIDDGRGINTDRFNFTLMDIINSESEC